MKMTVRKANADRKAIDSRIVRLNNEISKDIVNFTAYYKKCKPIIGTKTPNEVNEEIKERWQSLNDLLIRRSKLNLAVMQVFGGLEYPSPGVTVNAYTLVEVRRFNGLDNLDPANPSYEFLTIAQAIARKKYFENTLRPLIKNIQRNYERVSSRYEKYTQILEKEWLEQVNSQFGPESAQTAKQRLEYQESIKPQYEAEFIDPLKIKDRIEKILDLVDWYATEIDSIISKATETTEIEVAD